MTSNSIAFISAVNDDKKYNTCKEYINKLKLPDNINNIEIIPIYNANSITSAYNKGMNSSNAKYKIYLHQDLLISDEEFLIKLLNAFNYDNDIGILGVVGAITIPSNGIWWDGKIIGIIYDTHTGGDIPTKYVYKHSNTEVIYTESLDGCILCTNRDITWDEYFDKWDFYDVSQVYRFIESGYKAGIIPSDNNPLVTHLCGKCNMTNYHEEKRKFIRKYINKNKILNIKVLCCGGATGGIELLHQLVKELNKDDNVDAKMCYIEYTENSAKNHIAYNEYNTPFIGGIGYNFNKDEIVIFPEIWAHWTNDRRYRECKKVIYWESVDNYTNTVPKNKLNIFPDDCIHIVQSYYAYDYVLNTVKIPRNNILFVSDYLNNKYIDNSNNITNNTRLNRVLYNPKKGYNFVEKIINRLPNIEFVKIENMSTDKVIEILSNSKLYIDFGNHPGKDRIPREAVVSGCCIITGIKGSAKYKRDINISNEYKYDQDKEENLDKICNKIIYILDHYEECYKDFIEYRKEIIDEYNVFHKEVNNLIDRLNTL